MGRAAAARHPRDLHSLFLLDSVLRDSFTPSVGEGIWRLGTGNCALSTFSRGETRTPVGTEVPDWSLVSWMERPWDPI